MKSRAKPNAIARSRRDGRALTRGQRWTFRALALLSPVLLLAVIEIFLRLSGHGYATGFFLRERVNGREVLVENRRFGWRFFPRDMARTPQPVAFSARKEPGTIRLFVFGESAAMGDPEPAFGLPRMLQAMLELKFPSNRFEVINVAMTAINSHVVREIAKDCAPLDGDIWIIYMGNNEVVGPFGSGTIFGRQAPGLAFIRGSLWLKQFRLAQLVQSFREDKAAPEWGGMEMFLKQQVRRDDPRMARVYAHFRENLQSIIGIGADAGAKVIVSTVAVNLKDSPPFASQFSAEISEGQRMNCEKALANAVAAVGAGEFALARHQLLAIVSQAGRGDAHGSAELSFHLGRCELELGNSDEARRYLELAREHDTLRFRADAAINRICTSNSARLNAEQVLREAGTNSIPGADFFHEHVHLNFPGNYALAAALFREVAKELRLKGPSGLEAPSMEDCARRLAFTDWDRLQVYEEVRKRMQQPPFTAQFGHAARDAEWKRRIDQLGASLTAENFQRVMGEYRAAIGMAPDDWVLRENFAKLLEANGEPSNALAQWREVMRLLPHEILAHYHAGNLLDAMGRSEEALPFFREALRRNPASLETRNGLALALMALGRAAEAEKELQMALRLKPSATEARVNLGQLFAQQGRTNEAIAQYELALRHDTNSAAPHINLGRLLNLRGDRTGALAHYRAAVRINPKSAVAHYNLGNVLLAQSPEEAVRHYEEAVRARPDFAEAHLALALELARRGVNAEAARHFQEAIRLQPGSVDAHFNYGVLLAQQKKFAEALEEFSATLKLQPNHPRAAEFLRRAQAMK